MRSEGAKENNVLSLKTVMQIEMPIKRIEGALFWLQETTRAKTLDEALETVWLRLAPAGSKKQVEMVGMLMTVRRAGREGKAMPHLNIDEWYASIAG